ncbi:SRPBCC domain-containing protein [Bradyrhizobium sp. 38]|uniref:SRPBCC family protein n=1 Tax=unclassified Bradyrhizobium TaxID=2631580 RepID=UPI001FFBCD6A|nr:SRPBCC domain-containing protein [Bradyrhizobium sp. 38]MCK1782008.1 SRPBCC domain-containing protein [Bradyrhizobium sp. 132]
MTEAVALRSLIVERTLPYQPDKVWRVLTRPALIDRWLMKNDFELRVGHHFNFRAQPIYGWNGVTDCEVLEIVPNERLVYSWNASGEQAKGGLKTIVTWTLTAVGGGTAVRMEQSGFRPEDEGGYRAMGGGWPGMLAKMEEVGSDF